MVDSARQVRFAAAIAAAIAGSAGFAQAAPTVVPTYNAIDADTLKGVITAQAQSQITVDNSDPQGPILKVQMPGGLVYSVYMDDCDNGQPNLCRSLEYRAALPAGALNFAQINNFNDKMRYATAYLTDKGVPQLRMDENLRGGVTADFVAFTVQIFVKVVTGFVQEAK